MTKKAFDKPKAKEAAGKPFDLDAWWAKLDRYRDTPFLPEGRPEQPPMPPPRKIFDDE
jgi:hypothetical protein